MLAQASQPLASRREGIRHEQDPEQWWRSVVAVCRKVLAEVPARSVKGIAVDGTSGTILLTDRSGEALTPGLMYDDSRAQSEAQTIRQNETGTWESLAYHMQPSWALPKLLWLLHERGDRIRDVRLAHQVDFINQRLAGCEVATDWTNALKTGYDLINERWPYEDLNSLGVPHHILPAVVEPGTQIGTVCRETAKITGLPEGIPIIAGLTDACAAQISAGALDVGSWNCVLGTTLVVKGVTSKPVYDPLGIMYSHRLPERRWLPGGASNSGAGVIAHRFPEEQWERLSTRAESREHTKVLAYPLLARGERFPFSAPLAAAFVVGSPHDDVELYAALMQGAGFVARLSFDYVDMLGTSVTDITLTGGATRSHYWCQLSADTLGRPVRLPENADPAFGMAVLAASVGQSLSQVAKQMTRIREVIDPRAGAVAGLSHLYIRFVDELAQRGWLPPQLADHARQRSGQRHAA